MMRVFLLKSARMAVLSFMFFLNIIFTFSQNRISGKVLDQKTGEALIGATVIIESLKKGIVTDFEGQYTMTNIPDGKYNVLCKLISYKDKVIENVELSANSSVNLNFTMEEPSGTNLNEIVVVGDMNRENMNTILIEQKNRATVSDGISAEVIKKTPDRNTSDVLKRVSGATIQENKFAIIRGLNDRYNAAYLNGAPLPSSESDRKAFSFDIFPSNLLDNLIIVKTATPDVPADFSGGIIQINTKNVPDKNFNTFSVGVGYNTLATGKEQITYQGSSTDWIGIDNGTRSMPKGLPERSVITSNTPAQNAELARQFNYDWKLNRNTFAPNLSFQYTGAAGKRKGEQSFGAIYALTYSKSNNFFIASRNDFQETASDSVDAQQEFGYDDKNYVTNVLAGALVNLTFRPNLKNTFNFKNIYNINTEDRVVQREGERDKYIPNDVLLEKSTVMWFTENRLYSGQLSGEHILYPQLKMKWAGNYSQIKRDIPNLRRFIQTRRKFKNDPNDQDEPEPLYEAAIQSSGTSPTLGGNFFFSENRENTYGGQAEVAYNLSSDSSNFRNEIKIGGGFQLRQRDFVSRFFGYSRYGIAGGSVSFDRDILQYGQDSIFSPNNIGIRANGKGGFKIDESTKPSDSYDANSELFNAFLMDDMRLGKYLRFIYGVRFENFNQYLNSFAEDGAAINVKYNQSVLLPSINSVFSVTNKSNIRFGYAKTVSRPEYRELAPFGFYDFNINLALRGNDKLRPGSVDNFDLRFEFFPGQSQLLSASLFYKKFRDAIEQISSDVDLRTITFQNANSATNIGFETEFRVGLNALFGDSIPVIKDLTVFSNFSYINSKVTVDKNAQGALAVARPLQGQSPYIINSGVQYQNNHSGFGASVSYNRIGRRIFVVGNTLEPNIYEQGRDVIDMQINKTFLKNKLEVRLNLRDLLAQKLYFYQDENKNGKLNLDEQGNPLPITNGNIKNRKDNIMFVNNNARVISLSLTYKL
jgi:outer membrane receptor protein involved in Fe transport